MLSFIMCKINKLWDYCEFFDIIKRVLFFKISVLVYVIYVGVIWN